MGGGLTWETIPEPLLVRILSYLSLHQIAQTACVCRRWLDISEDNFLWRGLLRRNLKVRRCLRPREPGHRFKDDYRRLVDTTPAVCDQELTEHADEVLHVSFSHSGSQFVTCSKDAKVIVWRLEEKAVIEYQNDMRKYTWRYTWASKYNATDTLLLVAGVKNDVHGEIAIFNRDQAGHRDSYNVVCRVSNNPYDVMGDWASNTHFFSGRLTPNEDFNQFSSSLFMCRVDPEAKTSSMSSHHQLLRVDDDNTSYMRCLHVIDRNVFKDDTVFDNLDKEQNRFEGNEAQPETVFDESCMQVLTSNRICLIFLSNSESTAPHLLGFCLVQPSDLENPPIIRTPDRVIDLKGHIVGVALSPDHRYLYANVRRWPANSTPNLFESPPIASEIEMRVVDLKSLELMEDVVFTGHRGFTDSLGAFYIYINVGVDLVASGSEDGIGRIWDRQYGCLLAELKHTKCVNACAFCPSNQQILVSVGDDNLVKVWKSKALKREEKECTQQIRLEY